MSKVYDEEFVLLDGSKMLSLYLENITDPNQISPVDISACYNDPTGIVPDRVYSSVSEARLEFGFQFYWISTLNFAMLQYRDGRKAPAARHIVIQWNQTEDNSVDARIQHKYIVHHSYGRTDFIPRCYFAAYVKLSAPNTGSCLLHVECREPDNLPEGFLYPKLQIDLASFDAAVLTDRLAIDFYQQLRNPEFEFWESSLHTDVINKFYERIRGSSFNILTSTFSEGRETVKYLFDNMKLLVDIMRAIKARDAQLVSHLIQERLGVTHRIGSAGFANRVSGFADMSNTAAFAHSVDQMSALWLEWRYAIRPLVNDIQQALLAWDKLKNQVSMKTFKERARIKRSNTFTIPFPVAFKIQNANWNDDEVDVTVMFDVTYTSHVRYGLLGFYFLRDVITDTLQLTNFTSAMWEAIPYSFVADWFYPIGKYLQARDEVKSISVSSVEATRKHTYKFHAMKLRYTQTLQIRGFDYEISYLANLGYFDELAYMITTFSRSMPLTIVEEALPQRITTAVFTMPTHLADAIALLNNAMKSFRR